MGNSYSSDQTTLNLATIGSDTLSRLGRARITSIQGKGIASSLYYSMMQQQQVRQQLEI